MYLCNLCKVTVKGPQQKHIYYREDKSILKEITVCHECKVKLMTHIVSQLEMNNITQAQQSQISKVEQPLKVNRLQQLLYEKPKIKKPSSKISSVKEKTDAKDRRKERSKDGNGKVGNQENKKKRKE